MRYDPFRLFCDATRDMHDVPESDSYDLRFRFLSFSEKGSCRRCSDQTVKWGRFIEAQGSRIPSAPVLVTHRGSTRAVDAVDHSIPWAEGRVKSCPMSEC